MIKDHAVHHAGVGRRAPLVILALTATLVSLWAASGALAKQPTGDFAVFKQCPRFTAEVNLCLYAQVTGGVATLNKLSVPIVNTATLQFGIIRTATETETVVGALDGETLSPTPQPVPGGLADLIDCDEIEDGGILGRVRRRMCRGMLDHDRYAAVNVTTELARPASEIYINANNELALEGTALALPVKIHIENPLLGRHCYIGSSANPIVFALTVGMTNPPPPNKPIAGHFGLLSAKDEFEFLEVTEHVQVDNSFSVPEATGCGGHLSFLIDPLINSKIGLPSPAGYNTIVHSGIAKEGTTVGVIASEQEPNEKHHEHNGDRGAGHPHWWH